MSAIKINVRAPNYKSEEVKKLIEVYRSHIKTLEGKFSQNVTQESKANAWRDIQQKVNAIGGFNRSVADLKKKFANIKSSSKQIESANRRERRKTGGGSAEETPLNEIQRKIIEILPEASIEGIKGGIDLYDDENSEDLFSKGIEDNSNAGGFEDFLRFENTEDSAELTMRRAEECNRNAEEIKATFLSVNTDDTEECNRNAEGLKGLFRPLNYEGSADMLVQRTEEWNRTAGGIKGSNIRNPRFVGDLLGNKSHNATVIGSIQGMSTTPQAGSGEVTQGKKKREIDSRKEVTEGLEFTPIIKRVKEDSRLSTSQLMKRQLDLMNAQTEIMGEIRDLLRERNEIEKEKMAKMSGSTTE